MVNCSVFKIQYNNLNLEEYDMMGSLARQSVICSNNADCIGFKLIYTIETNFCFRIMFLLLSQTCIKEIESFIIYENLITTIVYRDDIATILPLLITENPTGLQSIYADSEVSATSETQFAVFNSSMNHSLAQYEKGFEVDNSNYFRGLIFLSKVSLKYSKLSLKIYLMRTGDSHPLSFLLKFNEALSCTNKYKLDIKCYKINSDATLTYKEGFTQQLNVEFITWDTKPISLFSGFGFWTKDSGGIIRENGTYYRKYDDGSYEVSSIVLTLIREL
ncbi:hypothetical protein SNEBB_002194 [Seison nebaliae]|nr:hypothetical protein SNEBB_002194 [Seison nebaliae]